MTRGKSFFVDRSRSLRYLSSLLLLLLMVGVSELLGEREVIFPEVAALSVGMWIVDKQVWRISRLRLLLLMTVGATVGVCIVRYSPFPLLVDIALSFIFTAVCLIISQTTLMPLISACMLPVLLQTSSWVYPVAVFVLSLLLVVGQLLMERLGLRRPVVFARNQRSRKKEVITWLLMLLCLVAIAFVPIYTSQLYFILPPLVVTFAEFACSKAGFRNRPIQIWLLLTVASLLGTSFQIIGHQWLHLPETAVAMCIIVSLFTIFELLGKCFAPAAAIALIPLIVPQDNLIILPLQVAGGAAMFIGTAMLLFLKCYKWPKAQLIVSLFPVRIRPKHHDNKKQDKSHL